MTDAPKFRYWVTGVWGHVPDDVKQLIDRADAYLVYPEYRGLQPEQGFVQDDELVGGWYMSFAGRRPA